MSDKEMCFDVDTKNKNLEKESEKNYYKQSLKDGYRGVMGAIIGTFVAEAILWFAGIKFSTSWVAQSKESSDIFSLVDNVPLIFIFVGFMFTLRHLAQIWQAKTQLKQISLDN